MIFSLFIKISAVDNVFGYVVDSAYSYASIDFIGSINSDCRPDTIIALGKDSRNLIPSIIVWGNSRQNNDIPDSLEKVYTKIVYPTWDNLKVRLNPMKINNDTITDLLIIVWGRLPLDSTHYKDTATAVIIFGKKYLDTLAEIHISEIDSMTLSPFVAMKLPLGVALSNCAIRDYSHIPSYKVNNVNIDTNVFTRPSEVNALIQSVKVYPNPAVYYANIELSNFASGDYNAELYSSYGEKITSQSISLTSQGDITRNIDLSNIATGYYMLKLFAGSKPIGSYQIIVVK